MKVSIWLLLGGLLLSLLLILGYRVQANERTNLTNNAAWQRCQEPRPTICYEVFNPVCANFSDKQSRSLPPRTFANDCKACADPAVAGFVPGACH
ncbi:MAG: hypothetical protein ACK4RS_00235 [Thiothrix sp.]